MSYYIHNVPGRLRIRIPCIKSKKMSCLEIEEILAAIPGVIEVGANAVTGSVLVRYRTDQISSARIVEELKDMNYLDATKVRTDVDHLKQAAAGTGERIGKALIGWGLGRVLEENGLALLASLI